MFESKFDDGFSPPHGGRAGVGGTADFGGGREDRADSFWRGSSEGGYGAQGGAFADRAGGCGGGEGAGHGAGADLFGPLPEDEARRLASSFERYRDPSGYVPQDAGRRALEKTRLPHELLQEIWELSDLDRDGRLSLREFVCAMHLAEQAKSGRSMPSEVTTEQQQAMVRAVERLAPGAAGASRSPHRGDDLSIMDTAASGRGRGGSDVFGSVVGGDHAGDPRGRVQRPHGERGAGRLRDREGLRERPGALGQLAAVFEALIQKDEGAIPRYTAEILRERQQLEEQLARRRELESELKQVRQALDKLRDDRRQTETDASAVRSRITHLQDEVAFVQEEMRIAEGEVDDMHQAIGTHMRKDHSYDHAYDPTTGVKLSERQQLAMDQVSIADLRLRLQDMRQDKLDLQAKQHELIEQQRLIEQDRGLTLTAIHAERTKLAETKQLRLKMYKERHALEEELLEHYARGELAEMPVMQPPPSAATDMAMEDIARTVQSGGSIKARAADMPAPARPPLSSAAGARRADHRGVRHDAAHVGISGGTMLPT